MCVVQKQVGDKYVCSRNGSRLQPFIMKLKGSYGKITVLYKKVAVSYKKIAVSYRKIAVIYINIYTW